MERCYFVVEGPHDVELIGRVLKPEGFKRVLQLQDVDPFWLPLVPREFPVRGDLAKRVPVPVFFARDDVKVAISTSEGGNDERLITTLQDSLDVLRRERDAALSAVGVLLDADDRPPSERLKKVAQGMARCGLTEPPLDGTVLQSSPRAGVFALPDNRREGTLEDLLVVCGQARYPELHAAAEAFVRSVDLRWEEFAAAKDDLKFIKRPAGPKKARLGAMASVLRPGKAIQMSIQDNRWLEPASLTLPELAPVVSFIRAVVGLAGDSLTVSLEVNEAGDALSAREPEPSIS